MNTLLRFLYKSSFFLLFVFLEIISLNLTLKNDIEKEKKWVSSTNAISGFFLTQTDYLNNFFLLKKQNNDLVDAYTQLQTKNKDNYKIITASFQRYINSNKIHVYDYLPSEVLKNSISMKNNHLTILGGKKHGINQGMAVVAPQGVVGVIRNSSENFAVAISLLNTKLTLSAKLHKDKHFGSIHWNGNSDFILDFDYIPDRVNALPGDTVVTSGYSFIFPKNIPIAIVTDVKKDISTSFLKIKAKPIVDFGAIDKVWIIKNLLNKELKEVNNSNNLN